MLLSKSRFNILAAIAMTTCTLTLTMPAVAQNGPGFGTPVTVQPLNADEVKWLQFMREEEKLAFDVYTALYQKWNLMAFKNIAASEDAHFNAIGTLLKRYGVADPVQQSAGVYSDPALNELYNQLMSKAMTSAQDALEVGILIEKQDIADLENAMKATTKFDIKRVFSNLMNGSYNHLDAFETVCTIATTSAN